LLWYGERDTRFRLASTILVHDGLMYASLVLFVGHLYLSLIHPTTRHALRGITLGSVREEWARAHHAKWAGGALDEPDHDDHPPGAAGGRAPGATPVADVATLGVGERRRQR